MQTHLFGAVEAEVLSPLQQLHVWALPTTTTVINVHIPRPFFPNFWFFSIIFCSIVDFSPQETASEVPSSASAADVIHSQPCQSLSSKYFSRQTLRRDVK